ncbi:hypothetical protein Tco_1324150 [Tanacetum coccineum]
MKELLKNCHEHSLTKGNIIKIFYHGLDETTQEALNTTAGGIFLYKTPNQAYQLLEDKVLLKLDWAKNQKPKTLIQKNIAFADEGISNSDTDKIMARIDAIAIKIDAQCKEMKSRIDLRSGRTDYNRDYHKPNSDDKPSFQKQLDDFIKSQQETNLVVKETFMDLKTKLETSTKNQQASIQNLEAKFDRLADKKSTRPSADKKRACEFHFVILKMKKDSKVPLILRRRFLHTANAVIHVKQKQLNLAVGSKRMVFSIDSTMKHSYSNNDTCFSIDVIDEILEEDFNALLEEGSKILYFIEGIPLEDEIFAKFDDWHFLVLERI